MATTTTTTNKPLNPRAQDLSPKGYNRAALFSGKALSFDGVNDQVTCANVSQISTGDVSVALNVRFGSSGVKDEVMFWQGTAATNSTMAFLLNSVGAIRFSVYGAGNDVDAPVAETQTNVWMHLVMTFNRTTKAAKIYKNGRLIASGTTAGVPTTTGNFLIGRNASTAFATISMAGLKLYGAELTAAQVADLYLNPEKITPDGVATSALKLWLPMMEGAGASAYDGSGNGNDGTINGATWTAGVGAPVAQTALVSWNKGVNILKYSRAQFTAGSVENWNEGGGNPLTPLSVTGIDGQTNAAATYLNDQNSDADFAYYRAAPVVSGTQYKVTGWLKLGTATNAVVVLNNSVDWNTITGGNFVATAAAGYDQWKEFSITFTAPASTTINIHVGYHLETGVAAQTLGSFYMDAFSLRRVSDGDAYIKTNATAQTSAVLVPEGLTAGASIFGTDIITPRNAFALNLDGASWAQIGRNSSVSPTTAITLEAWLNKSDKTGYHHLISRNSVSSYYYAMFTDITTGYLSFQGSAGSPYVTADVDVSTGSWVHCLVTYNTTSALFYVNGTLVATKSITTGLVPNDVDIFIGARPNGIQLFDGDIANPRIYNRALTAAEVLRNYNADKAKFGL